MALFRSSGSLAIFLLVLGKAFGIAGLIVGPVNRVAGGLLLALDAVLIVAALTIALRESRRQAKEADDDKAVLARLAREGTLKQYLREIEETGKDEAKAE